MVDGIKAEVVGKLHTACYLSQQRFPLTAFNRINPKAKDINANLANPWGTECLQSLCNGAGRN